MLLSYSIGFDRKEKFGEFSALHKNLKEGLIELGHDAVVAAGG